MKKLSLLLATLFSLSGTAMAASIPGSTGQMKFTGSITETGCVMETGNTSIIDLGSVSLGTLDSSPHSRAYFGTWTEGQIKFVGCDLNSGISAVYLTVLPTDAYKPPGGPWMYRNQGSATGVDVQVRIVDDEGAQDLGNNDLQKYFKATIDPVNRTALYVVKGRLYRSSEVSPQPGSVEVTLTFVAHYK